MTAGVTETAGVAGFAGSAVVDVLVPTCGRPAALAVTLAALGASSGPAICIVVSDQSALSSSGWSALPASSAWSASSAPGFACFRRRLSRRLSRLLFRILFRILSCVLARSLFQVFPRCTRGGGGAALPACAWDRRRHVSPPGVARHGRAARLHAAMCAQRCGFVGSAVHGLSYLGQVRPEQEAVVFWDGPVQPETVRPGTAAWARHHLHSAANLFHVQSRLAVGQRGTPGPHAPAAQAPARLYRVAWIGGCVVRYRPAAPGAGRPCVGIFWLTNLVDGTPLRQGLLHAALSWRVDCPVCGMPNLERRCSHDTSFVADVPAERVIELAARALEGAPASA